MMLCKRKSFQDVPSWPTILPIGILEEPTWILLQKQSSSILGNLKSGCVSCLDELVQGMEFGAGL